MLSAHRTNAKPMIAGNRRTKTGFIEISKFASGQSNPTCLFGHRTERAASETAGRTFAFGPSVKSLSNRALGRLLGLGVLVPK